MHTFRLFALVELAALLGLLSVATAMALAGFLSTGTAFQNPADAAKTFFLATLYFGVVPVVLLGAPSYFALIRYSQPRWPHVLLIGVAPGILALPLDLVLGSTAIVCGVVVASVTHILFPRLGPNNSFKPRPLRGSA